MNRTTIVLPEELRTKLRLLAAERGVSMSEVIRQAMEAAVNAHRPKPRSIGMGDSGRSDISRRASDEPYEPEPWR